MAEYLSPGVFIQERIEGARPIAGVATSVASFVGKTERGPKEEAVLCSGYNDYERVFGGMKKFQFGGSEYEYFNMPLAIQSFIKNGGVRFYAVRVFDAGGAVAEYTINDGATPVDKFTIKAKNEGIWGNRLAFTLKKNLADDSKWDFTLFYKELPDDADSVVLETYEALSLSDPTSKYYFPTVVNGSSNYVEIVAETDADDLAAEIDTETNLADGTEPTDPTAINIEDGLEALDVVNGMLMSMAPDFWDEVDGAVAKVLIDDADRDMYRFAILNVPKGKTPQEAQTHMTTTINKNSKRYAMYYPNVKVLDPLTAQSIVFTPVGHVGGCYARTDINRNVAKAPAGITDGALRSILKLERTLKKSERDSVYPYRVNPLVDEPQTGTAVWGCRTGSLDPAWRYIQITRLFQFLEKSTFEATHWVCFENNNPSTRLRVKLQMEGFLLNLFNEGYFAGASPAEAFQVVCDKSNNPQTAIDAGLLYCDIAVSPEKPSEFVVFRFSQKRKTA